MIASCFGCCFAASAQSTDSRQKTGVPTIGTPLCTMFFVSKAFTRRLFLDRDKPCNLHGIRTAEQELDVVAELVR